MHHLIAVERRLAEVEANARTYAQKCDEERRHHLTHSGARGPGFYAAAEGLCAVRTIIRRAK